MQTYLYASRHYKKLTRIQKEHLLYLYYYEGKNIKQASRILKLNYPAAKALIKSDQMKKLRRNPIYGNQNPCSYRNITNNDQEQLNINQITYTLIILLIGNLVKQELIQIQF